ncbi:MAG: replicative DNA helicase [Symploca sp. SIO2G7]|nr:replicative DNA helicase [Symploca sp. SIO2G7]
MYSNEPSKGPSKEQSNVVELQLAENSLPPQNIDAEESILGGILLDPEAIGRVADILLAEAFYIKVHRDIYQAALLLYSQSKPTDLMSVTSWLYDHESLEKVGGQSKLAQLVERTVSAVNIDCYAKLVMDKYHRRKLIEAGNEIVRLGHELPTPLENLIDESAERIFWIQEQSRQSDRYQLESAEQMAIPLWESIEQGLHAGIPTGWSDLDELTGGLHRKTITIVGADSHMGKTSFMVGLSHQILTEVGKPVLFLSCEMSKEQLNPRLLARVSGIDSSRLAKGDKPGGITQKEWGVLANAIGSFSELSWLVYDEPSPSISTIRSVVKQAISRKGNLGACFLDYIQMLRLDSSQNRVQELGELTRQLRAIAKDFDFPFFVGSQVNRELGKRNNKRPTKNDLRDSGEIGEAADLVICLYRDAHYSKNPNDKNIEIIVDKNRPYGKLGTAKMMVNLETCNFMQVDNRYRDTVDEFERF